MYPLLQAECAFLLSVRSPHLPLNLAASSAGRSHSQQRPPTGVNYAMLLHVVVIAFLGSRHADERPGGSGHAYKAGTDANACIFPDPDLLG